jgi:hypothetical protein
MSDAGRLALLLKHGGFYSDLDTITLKSFASLRKYNGAGYLYGGGNDMLGNGFLHFEADHPFVKFIISRLVKRYDPNNWSAIGPDLFVSGMAEYCKMSDIFSKLLLEPLNRTKAESHNSTSEEENGPSDETVDEMDNKKCNLTIFPQRYFYPYTWESPELYTWFNSPNSTIDFDRLVDTFSLHFYGKFTSAVRVNPLEKCVFNSLASSYCPRVYEHVKSNRLEF